MQAWPGAESVDHETGTRWDALRGRAVAGSLKGNDADAVPYFSIWDWALRLHYGKDTPIYPLELTTAT